MSQSSVLDEQRRQHYLTAMGISSWYPRAILAHAPKPLGLAETTADAPLAEAQAQAESPLAAVRPERANQAAEPARPARIEAAPARPRAATVPRFGLSLSVVGPLLIADSLPRGQDQAQQAAQQLLWNILAAVGQSEAALRTHHIVQWPLFTNPRVDQGIDQARIYVDEKLEQFQRQFGPRWLLSFGGVMPKLNRWQQPQGEHQGLTWVALPSLQKMLLEPQQKAVAWSRLKPLLSQM